MALEIVQRDTFLSMLGSSNLFAAIKILKNPTESKVFCLLKYDHRLSWLTSVLFECE